MYGTEQIDETTVRVRCNNPYACAFDRGIIEAVANEFADHEIVQVEETGNECRADGGEACV